MEIAHAQLRMYTNIMYKFQSSTWQNCRRKAPDKIVSTDRWTDTETDNETDRRPWRFKYTPLHFVVGGIENALWEYPVTNDS